MRWFLAFIYLSLIAGCAGLPEKPTRACVGLMELPPVVSQGASQPVADLPAMMSRIIEGDLDKPPPVRTTRKAKPVRPARPIVDINILAISTGGQYGAFAAGFLAGWSDEGGRPDFDLVTGASAGATIAPLVFAGVEFDDRLELVSAISERDVVRPNGVLGVLTGAPSLYNTKPLWSRINAALDEELLAAIAEKWEGQNELLLGATDLRSGRFESLHIGEYVATSQDSTEEKARCVTDAVMASSAIPGLFPPIAIGNALYADAGIREHIFFADVARELRRAADQRGARLRVNATLLVNSDLRIRPEPVEAKLQPIATRSFELVIDEGLRNSLLNTIRVADENNWRLRAISAPDVKSLGCSEEEYDKLFSKCITEQLFARGKGLARAPIPWMTPDALKREIQKF